MEEPKEFVLKTSRIYFLTNYIIAVLVVVFLLLLYFIFGLRFTLFSKTQSELISTLTFLGILLIAAAMVEQPEWERFRKRLIITMNEVMLYEGILRKEKIILPYATVADIRIDQGVLGRILDYGTLSVSSFKTGSDMIMKGVRHPHKIYVVIQNRVNLIREGQMSFFGKDEKPKEEKE